MKQLSQTNIPFFYSSRFSHSYCASLVVKTYIPTSEHSRKIVVHSGVVLQLFISPLPRWNWGNFRFPRRLSVCPSVRWNRGDFRFPRCLSVCLSVRLSVHAVSVHSVFLSELFSVVLWDIDLEFGIRLYLDMIQIKFDFCRIYLTFFYLSYCPLQKFSFPDFSQSSCDILTWNLVYDFVLTWYRSSSTFVAFDLL